MRNFTLLFTGIFFCVAFAFCTFVIANHKTIGSLTPLTEDGSSSGPSIVGASMIPPTLSGKAEQGRKVYLSMGCASCHTQQIGQKNYDIAQDRGWGSRASHPIDYIGQDPVLLGHRRIGPDLSNMGLEEHDEAWHLAHLYNPRSVKPDSKMPSYPFLFKKQKINDRKGPSSDALVIESGCIPPEGYEIVPTDRAIALASYLLSLKQDYALPASLLPSSKAAGVGGDAAEAVELTKEELGKQLYETRCMMCHQATGKGMPGAFPPLTSAWVNGSTERMVSLVLSGMSGPMTVDGSPFNGNMPAWASQLDDKQVAAVLSYIRSQWGNSGVEVSEEEVKAVRDEHGSRSAPWTEGELLELFPLEQ